MEENKNHNEPEKIEQTASDAVEEFVVGEEESTEPQQPQETNETKTQNPKKFQKSAPKNPLGNKLWIIITAVVLVATVIVLFATGIIGKKVEYPPVETTTNEIITPEPTPQNSVNITSATIVSGNSAAEQTAAKDLKKYLELKGVAVNNTSDFKITLSIDESLGEDSYRVTASVKEGSAKSLTIAGGNGRGILYGVYGYLEECANVRFFTPELEVCEPGDVYVTDGVILDYTPTFELRQTNWYNWIEDDSKYTWSTKNGINIISGWTRSWGEELGGSLTYAPDLFVHTIGKLAELDVDYPAYAVNPCMTDEAIYNKVLANVLKKLEEYPDTKILSVSQNDNPNYCECDKCSAIIEEEGSAAGPLLRFVNRIAEAVAPLYPNVTIDTLAYNYSLPAPKVTKPAENVCIRLSTINCHFNHVLTKADCYGCSQFSTAIKEWGKICNNLYVWDYTTNYRHYLTTFPNFHVLRENVKFFAENNVKGVFEQGNSSGPSGEFGELRAYLITKLLQNPYMTGKEYDTHMKEFLAAYYGDGWEYILKYINSFKTYATTSGANASMGVYSSPLTVVSKNALGDMEANYTSWWDSAEALAGDRLEYVQRSRVQLRYLMLFVHPDKDEALSLVEYVEGNGISWREGWKELLWYVYSNDNELLGLAPDKWFKE